MNQTQLQLIVNLETEELFHLLTIAIEKGTENGLQKVVNVLQQHLPNLKESETKPLESIRRGSEHISSGDLIDVNVVAALLGVSPRMVYRLRDSGRMPKPTILGRLIRWQSKEIEHWIQAGCPPVLQRGIKRK